MYINLELINIERDPEKFTTVKIVKTCFNDSYNFLDYILSYRNNIDLRSISVEERLDKIQTMNVCEYCKCTNCIKKSVTNLINEVDRHNSNNINKLSYISIIDYILNRKCPEFKVIPQTDFFSNVDLIDLMYIQLLLENDWIYLVNVDKKNNIIEFNYLDLIEKPNNEYYINILIDYYKSKKKTK